MSTGPVYLQTHAGYNYILKLDPEAPKDCFEDENLVSDFDIIVFKLIL